MRVSAILAQYHRAANLKVLKEKDDKIDQLQQEMKQEREEAKARFEATVKHHEAVMAQFGIALTDREAKHSETIAELHLTQVKICIFCIQFGAEKGTKIDDCIIYYIITRYNPSTSPLTDHEHPSHLLARTSRQSYQDFSCGLLLCDPIAVLLNPRHLFHGFLLGVDGT
jgi:hypothetical protein